MSDVTVEDFSRLVSGVYAAAVTPQHWEAAIREIHHTMGATAGGLVTPTGEDWAIQSWILPIGATDDYTEYYCRIDHVQSALGEGPVGAVRTGTELIAPRE